MDYLSTKSWSIKRLALLLFLIYGYQVAQSNNTETYFKGKELGTFLPIEHVGKTFSTLNFEANHRKKPPLNFQRTIVQMYIFMRPTSLLNHKFGSLARKYRLLTC
ncbi:MAG: hypothetical protein RLZZ292_1414 [Bacteroidota bacterium]